MTRNRQQSNAVSLFPFLAVLLCTMGSLIVLLMAMAYLSREKALAESPPEPTSPPLAEASSEASAAAKADDEQRRARLEQVNEKIAAIEQRREQLDQTLRDDQLRLSQVEDHIRRLADHLASLRAAIAELTATDAQHYDDRAQAERNLKQLQRMIADTKAGIEDLKKEGGGKHKAYSIVPYEGSNGTQRQPIYIECLADRVVLQPEGVVLKEEDFQRPLGVGNPLAAALRATREFHARDNPEAGYDPDSEPYPLILVRPEGVLAYYEVREAIRSWDADFGYELVEGDWELKYPAPNPVLANYQATAIERARMRRQLLARAAPRAYGGASFERATAGGENGHGAKQPYDGDTLGQSGGGAEQGSPFALAGQAPAGDGDSGTGQLGAGAQPQSAAMAGARGGGSPPGATSSNPGVFNPTGGGAGGAPTTVAGGEGGQASTAQAGGGSPSQQASSSRQQQGRGGAGDNSKPEGAAGAPSNSLNFSAAPPGKGDDWAVQKKSPLDIAIRRSVQVIVRSDRLIVLPDREESSSADPQGVIGETVPLDGPTSNGLEPFVNAVQREVRSWGIAGRGLYWRPELKLNVGPDGANRARELVSLLKSSGIEVSYERTAALPAPGGNDETR